MPAGGGRYGDRAGGARWILLLSEVRPSSPGAQGGAPGGLDPSIAADVDRRRGVQSQASRAESGLNSGSAFFIVAVRGPGCATAMSDRPAKPLPRTPRGATPAACMPGYHPRRRSRRGLPLWNDSVVEICSAQARSEVRYASLALLNPSEDGPAVEPQRGVRPKSGVRPAGSACLASPPSTSPPSPESGTPDRTGLSGPPARHRIS
jgi:hypothetical protein